MEKKMLPDGAGLAGMVRETGLKRVAEDYGVTPNAITKRLNKAGYRRSGHPFTERRVPVPARATAHDGWRPAPFPLDGAEDDRPDDWQDAALCAQVDGELFYPEKGGSAREGKRVCRACDVRAECLEYALAHAELDGRFGIWGGKSERERRKIVAKQRRGAAA